MVDLPVVDTIKRYLAVLPREGINASRAVLFGSFARGEEKEGSDIDLIVIAPEFDSVTNRNLVKRLWIARGAVDTRIEPIACGEKEWEIDRGRPILEVARVEGILVDASDVSRGNRA